MRCERLKLDGAPEVLAREIRDLVPASSSVTSAVAEIVTAVRARGDQAVNDYTRRFDTDGGEPRALEVSGAELRAAASRLDPSVRAGLEAMVANVRAVAEAGLEPDRIVELSSHSVALRTAAVDRVAVYVPGGRASYPSTVVMGVVPARVAGVADVVVCSPPGAEGEVSDVVLGTCALVGASAVYRMGGAQSIAALAYGTESVERVDMIVGPGNLYVQEAKRQVSDQVGIDGFAGPSDLLVVLDPEVEPALPALDLQAQAEHGPGSLVVAVSRSSELLDRLATELERAPETGAFAALVDVPDDDAAIGLAEAFAPEHLQLIGSRTEALSSRVSRAGCVFVGANAGTAFGDYIAGSNHILPTGSAARFESALSVNTFRRRFTEVRLGNPAALAVAAAPVARAEGFDMHARSMEARIRENG